MYLCACSKPHAGSSSKQAAAPRQAERHATHTKLTGSKREEKTMWAVLACHACMRSEPPAMCTYMHLLMDLGIHMGPYT